LKLLFTSN